MALAAGLQECGDVPCRTGDPDAWRPDRTEVDEPPARMAVDACPTCGARDACLAYALAADEREGAWGGLLPDQRRAVLRQAAA